MSFFSSPIKAEIDLYTIAVFSSTKKRLGKLGRCGSRVLLCDEQIWAQLTPPPQKVGTRTTKENIKKTASGDACRIVDITMAGPDCTWLYLTVPGCTWL